MSEQLDVEAFGALFRDFLEDVVHRAERPESGLLARLREHLGVDPRGVPITGATFAPFEHPDLQLGLESYLDGAGAHQLVGLAGGSRFHGSTADLLAHPHGPSGPVTYTELPVDVDERMPCIESGVILVGGDGEAPHAIVIRTQEHGPSPDLVVDVLSARPGHGSRVLEELREHMTRRSVYRGKVFALSNPHGPYERNVGASFVPRPDLDRGAIVLPDGVLARIERRTLGFDAVADRLAAGGQHRKRGLLLYGPPGTGKTLTARYLMGRLVERTVIVLTGASLGAIGPAAGLARRLQPAMLILEDVDLVAHDRAHGPMGNPLLFELLNELDGIGEDADIVVVLTTNRAELLEPALAARPGRVDLAVELPLPGPEERRRLLELYAAPLDVALDDWGPVVDRTEGTPASFVRELVRTAALTAAERGEDVLDDGHFRTALAELLDSGPVTAALLGALQERERTRPATVRLHEP